MPDEAQPLTAAKPEPASAAAAKPAPRASQVKNDTRGAVEHAHSAPVEKSAESVRPKQAPAERPAQPPVVRQPAAQPTRTASSNRVRARLARLGVQRANPYNPVLEPLLRIVRSNDPKIENSTLRQIERAYQVAERWHRGQKRKSGDPYITHPLAVTTILAELGMDPATLMAGLLHDTVEDTEYGLEDLRRDFGDVVALLVDGVTKLDKVKFGEAAQAETVRKMVVAMAKDPRVLVIKLADRLHNMRTMRYLKREKQEKKARETLEIYAPLAHRLGMNTIKWELEDLAFAILYPKMYDEIVRLVAERAPKRDEYLAIVTDEVQSDLRAARIKATVTGRPKHYYSVYQKMIVRGRDFAEIYDLVGIRVLVDTVRDCYAALGTVHARWNPVPGRFKDYIAMPKFNMYQSLHTTVIGPNGKPVELQIRTFDMHRRAEYGIAAHWKYKQEAVAGASKIRTDAPRTSAKDKDAINDMAWLRQLLDWQKETEDPGEFLESLRFDLSRNEVFVFTPKGDVIALPAGATPVDFAYAVHTEVGHRTIGARVNGRLVPLESTLDNGDLVEVFTSKAPGAGPSRDWLGFVKSPRARNKIRAWFSKERRDEAIEQGKDAIVRAMRKQNLPIQRILTGDSLVTLAHEMRYSDISALYAAIGEGHVSAQNIVQKLVQALGGEEAATEEIDETVPPSRGRGRKRRSTADPGVVVKGVDDVWVKLARCCTPVPGDPIIGFVTRGSGVSVHRSDCVNVDSLSREPERILDVEWAPTQSSVFLVAIQVEALDRSRLLSDVTRVLSDQHVNILSAAVQTSRDRVATSRFTFEMGDPKHLGHVLKAVRGVEGVYDVYRVTSGRSRS
ncbi:GTP pyrophosphokinase [Streptomyces rubradiris]|uniref:GTP pyrophosphokinase n=1 Tax=Streptomyces rubradiris TaxID=285531 RepID=A0ABQ3R5Q8_STRRR|nr:GTP pyrophosphokinase [Streptomyces rubradiris]GHH14924.1 GTP pyrophosphokinase [Streptomyces rubradiris]GHI51188.1 GTP pyrophosphokinase [Streptomyces rubradiris]